MILLTIVIRASPVNDRINAEINAKVSADRKRADSHEVTKSYLLFPDDTRTITTLKKYPLKKFCETLTYFVIFL